MISHNQQLPSLQNPGGEGGLVPRWGEVNFRSKCRFLEQILSFPRPDGSSIIPSEQVVSLVRGLMPVVAQLMLQARDNPEDKVVRALARVWGIWTSLARLEQGDRPEMHQHAHLHAEADADQVIELMEAEVRRLGLVPTEGDGNGSEQ